jgi:hypothetical protein
MKKLYRAQWGRTCAAAAAFLAAPFCAFAHEVYVLPSGEVMEGLHDTSINPFAALTHAGNFRTTLIIALCVIFVLVLNFAFQHSRIGTRLSTVWEKLNAAGPLIVRMAVAVSFFYSAETQSFLGPELHLSSFPFSPLFRIALYCLSVLLFLGLFTEYAAIISLAVFATAAYEFHFYMLTYASYVGEIVALILFGSRTLSLDRIIFGANGWFQSLQKYETLILRSLYGFSLLFAAISVKFVHAILTLEVVNEYGLTRFHFLFPHDPLLSVLGAGLAETAIALCIMLGFELRFAVLVSLFYITLSLIFFRELVWPHYILYGISLSLLAAPSRYGLDSWFGRKFGTLRRKA